MVSFPNCKINLGLHVTKKREDGFHDIETVFYPLTYCDVLEIVQADKAEADVVFSTSGLSIEGSPENNLCVKAYHLLKEKFAQLLPVKMHLHKKIPMGAGLGGGSADGAFALEMLNEKFHLGLQKEELMALALQLGSDCPFFIINEACLAMGRGEVLEKLQLQLSEFRIVVVSPGIHVNTGKAFSKLKPKQQETSLKEIIAQPVSSWKDLLKNDFEESVFEEHPAIAGIKTALYDKGAVYASMSGSGSCVYGLFKEVPEGFAFPINYITLIL